MLALRATVAACVVLAIPGASAAMAAEITGAAASPPVFTAAAGETNILTVTETATTLVFDDSVAITTTHPDCAANVPLPGDVTCTAFAGFFQVTINLDDGNDETTFVNADLFVSESGGPGTDTLRSAGAGSTVMDGGPDADVFQGGPGYEQVTYAGRTAAVTVTLDGAANDGEAGEGDNLSANIDDVLGGTGNDSLTGSAGDNFLTGGDGNDALRGGDGDDFLSGGAGADDYAGGGGVDSVQLSTFGPGPLFPAFDLTVTLDDAANDGAAGEGDNVRSDIEDVSTSGGNDSITGNASFNIISASSGNDTVDGGAGNDLLSGDAGNDTLRARDGFADRVSCGPGNDTAIVDTLDQLLGCETVQSADVGNASEDKPPTVSFTSPGPDARVPASGVDVNIAASDDRGVARVVLIDDGTVVGSDATAPYTIRYSPNGEDVGRDTLIAMAIDTTDQAGTAIQRVTVARFTPRGVSQRVTPSRDRGAPYRFRSVGSVSLPAGVTRAQGCGDGIVSVQVKRGTRTISTRRVTLKRDCTYSSTVSFADRRRLGTGRLKFTARFLGNEVLGVRTAPSRTARAG